MDLITIPSDIAQSMLQNIDIVKGPKNNPNLVEVIVYVRSKNGKIFPRKTKVLPQVKQAMDEGHIKNPAEYAEWYKKQTKQIKEDKEKKTKEIQTTEDPRDLIKQVSFRNGQRDINKMSDEQRANLIAYLNEVGIKVADDAKPSKIANAINSARLARGVNSWPEPKMIVEKRKKEMVGEGQTILNKMLFSNQQFSIEDFEKEGFAQKVNIAFRQDPFTLDFEGNLATQADWDMNTMDFNSLPTIQKEQVVDVANDIITNLNNDLTVDADDLVHSDIPTLDEPTKKELIYFLGRENYLTTDDVTFNKDGSIDVSDDVLKKVTDLYIKDHEDTQALKDARYELNRALTEHLPRVLSLNEWKAYELALSKDYGIDVRPACGWNTYSVNENNFDSKQSSVKRAIRDNLSNLLYKIKDAQRAAGKQLLDDEVPMDKWSAEDRHNVCMFLKKEDYVPYYIVNRANTDSSGKFPLQWEDTIIKDGVDKYNSKRLAQSIKLGSAYANEIKEKITDISNCTDAQLKDIANYIKDAYKKDVEGTNRQSKEESIKKFLFPSTEEVLARIDTFDEDRVYDYRSLYSQSECEDIMRALNTQGYELHFTTYGWKSEVVAGVKCYKALKAAEDEIKKRDAEVPLNPTDDDMKKLVLGVADGTINPYTILDREKQPLIDYLKKVKSLGQHYALDSWNKPQFYKAMKSYCDEGRLNIDAVDKSQQIEAQLMSLGIKSSYTRTLGKLSRTDKRLIAKWLYVQGHSSGGDYWNDSSLGKKIADYHFTKLQAARTDVDTLISKPKISLKDVTNLDFYKLNALQQALKARGAGTTSDKPAILLKNIQKVQKLEKERKDKLKKLFKNLPSDLQDVTQTFQRDFNSNLDPTGCDALLQVINPQGANREMTVVDTIKEVEDIAKESGCIMYRICNDHSNGKSSSNPMTPIDMINDSVYSVNTPLNYSPKRAYGDGMYFGFCDKVNDATAVRKARQTSASYGKHASDGSYHSYYKIPPSQMVCTLAPGWKGCDKSQIEKEFWRLPYNEQKKFGNYSVYAAAKGYDAMICRNAGGTGEHYVTVFNKSKMIVAREVLGRDGKIQPNVKVR